MDQVTPELRDKILADIKSQAQKGPAVRYKVSDTNFGLDTDMFALVLESLYREGFIELETSKTEYIINLAR